MLVGCLSAREVVIFGLVFWTLFVFFVVVDDRRDYVENGLRMMRRTANMMPMIRPTYELLEEEIASVFALLKLQFKFVSFHS